MTGSAILGPERSFAGFAVLRNVHSHSLHEINISSRTLCSGREMELTQFSTFREGPKENKTHEFAEMVRASFGGCIRGQVARLDFP